MGLEWKGLLWYQPLLYMNRCVPWSVQIKLKSVQLGGGRDGMRADDGQMVSVPGSRSGGGVDIQYPPLDHVENIHPWRRWAGEDSQPGPGAPAGAT